MVDVGCAGILVADTFCGPMKSLPQEGQVFILNDMPATVGGCAANVASALVKQGIKAGVAGCVGDDHGAQIVRGSLETRGVDTSQVRSTADFPTSQTVILVVEGEDRRFIHVLGANGAFAVDHIDHDWVAGLKVFYVGGLFVMPGFETGRLADLLKFCRTNNVVTVVDVVAAEGSQDFSGLDRCLPYIDYFLPNNDEAARLSGKVDPVQQALYFRDQGVETTVITRGSAGAIAVRGHDLWQVGVFDFEIVDPTGCGDAFDAGVIANALRGGDVPQMLCRAAALGGSCAQAIGCYDGIFTSSELDAFLQTNSLEVQQSTV